MAFGLRNANYNALKKLSLKRRLDALFDPPVGTALFQMLTPTQAASLFPKYWLEGHPDIGGFLKAIPSSVSAERQKQYEKQLENTATGAAAGENFDAGGYRREYQKNMNSRTASVSRRVEYNIPKMTPEQESQWNKILNGPVSVDETRSFANLSDEQLKRMNLSKYKDEKTGKNMIRYVAPEVTEEQARSSLQRGVTAGEDGIDWSRSAGLTSPESVRRASVVMKWAKEYGANDAAAAAIAGNMNVESAGFRSNVSGDQGASYGLFQFKDERRTAYLKWAHANGIDPASPKNQVKYALTVEDDPTFRNKTGMSVKEFLSANLSAREKSYLFMYGWERPSDDRRGGRNDTTRSQYTERFLSAGAAGVKPEGPNGTFTKQQIDAEIKRLREQQPNLSKEEAIKILSKNQADMQTGGNVVNSGRKSVSRGEIVGNYRGPSQQCAAYAQGAGVGPTSGWTPGTSARSGNLKSGDWVAAFHGGKYMNWYNKDHPGNGSHVARFESYIRDENGNIIGMNVTHQYNGSGGLRKGQFYFGSGGEMDADRYTQIVDRGRPATQHVEEQPSTTEHSAVPTAKRPSIQDTRIRETETPDSFNVKPSGDQRDQPASLERITQPQKLNINDVSDKANFGFQSLKEKKAFIIHHTGPYGNRNTGESMLETFKETRFPAHYVIDRDGNITRTLPSGSQGQHIRSGTGKYGTNLGAKLGLSNENTEGVEVIAKDDSDVTPAQKIAAARLAAHLGYNKDQVYGHGEINSHKMRTEGSTIVGSIRSGEMNDYFTNRENRSTESVTAYTGPDPNRPLTPLNKAPWGGEAHKEAFKEWKGQQRDEPRPLTDVTQPKGPENAQGPIQPKTEPVKQKTTPAEPVKASAQATPEPSKTTATTAPAAAPPVKSPSPAPASASTPPTASPSMMQDPKAKTLVPGKADGGPVAVNTEQIAAYPIDGLRSDNAVVVNAHQKPLFTMNTNEKVLMDPNNNRAQVIPENKKTDVGAGPQKDFTSGIREEFNSTINQIKKDFANLVPTQVEPPSRDYTQIKMIENGWLNAINQSSSDPLNVPSIRRVAYRAGGMETGDPSTGFHHSRGNNS